MKRALLGAVLVAGLLAVAGSASAQVSGYVITKKGSKCITRRNAGGKMTIVGTGCLTDQMNQKVTLDVGSGAMKIYNSCVERRGWDLVLASCNGSADQKFLLNLGTREITMQNDTNACLDLAGNAGDWTKNGDQRIGLYPCHKGVNQQWFIGTEKRGTVPPSLSSRTTIAPDVLHTLNGGEVIKGISSWMEVR
jgi:hypothetical protein